MSVGLFVDKTRQPETAELREALGGALPLWDGLVKFLHKGCGCDGQLCFYGRNYGWALRYRRWGWALVSMYPNSGFFTAQIVLSPRLVALAELLSLSSKTRKTLDSTHHYPEGRWLYLPVSSASDVEDVQTLVSLKFKGRRAE